MVRGLDELGAQLIRLTILLAAVTVAACAGGEPAHAPAAGQMPAPEAPLASASAVVDSALPMDTLLARFRADLPPVTSLQSGTASREALVRALVTALAAGDTAAVEALAPTRAEWGWLYYPTARTARPPYELPPALAWFQFQQVNRTGALRAFREFGGRPIEYAGHACAPQPVVEGDNRIWTGCTVSLVTGPDTISARLFSAILERDGRHALLSLHNDL